jgi:putative peptide zinc metalloprotease protein
VTDTYRLGRRGRLRTDLGGVYFNLVSSAVMAAAYWHFHFEPLLIAIVFVQLDALHQFFPFFRLDGYYVASDLIGVPDLFQRMRPMLSSFIPGRPLHPQIRALKPWARYALATWVYLTFVVVGYLYFLLLQALPRVLATAGESFMVHLTEIGFYWHHGPAGYVALAIFDELMLMFPLAILGITLVFLVRKLRALWRRLGEEKPTKRVAVGVAATALLVIPLPAVSSPAAYSAIKPSERGTLPSPRSLAPPTVSTPPVDVTTSPPGRSPSGSASAPVAASPTPTPNAVASPSAPPAASPSPAETSSPTPAASPTPTPGATATPTPSPVDTATPSPSPT